MSKVSLDPKVEQKFVAAAQRDPQKFSFLYEHYYPHIRRFFAVKLREGDVVDDLTSLTFEKALSKIGSFKWQGFPFSAWLYRIASNCLVDYFRREGKIKWGQLPDDLNVPTDEVSALDELQQSWERSTLSQLLGKLPAREQQIVYHKFYDGWSNKQIAQQLDLSESNVGTILHRVVSTLRQAQGDTAGRVQGDTV